jgi:hypothetical protein
LWGLFLRLDFSPLLDAEAEEEATEEDEEPAAALEPAAAEEEEAEEEEGPAEAEGTAKVEDEEEAAEAEEEGEEEEEEEEEGPEGGMERLLLLLPTLPSPGLLTARVSVLLDGSFSRLALPLSLSSTLSPRMGTGSLSSA